MKTKFFKFFAPLCIALLAMTFTSCEKPDDNSVKPPELPGEVDAVKGRHTATRVIDSGLIALNEDSTFVLTWAIIERNWSKTGLDTTKIEYILYNSKIYSEPLEPFISFPRGTLFEKFYQIKDSFQEDKIGNLTIYQHDNVINCGFTTENGIRDFEAKLTYQRAVYKDDYIECELPHLKYTNITSDGGKFGEEVFVESYLATDGITLMNAYHVIYSCELSFKFGSKPIKHEFKQTVRLRERAS